MKLRALALLASVSLFACLAPAQDDKPKLLKRPAVSATQVVFEYAGDLWTAPRNGGEAARLTTGEGTESDAAFSPDGSQVAFTGEYDGNVDVFVIPATGGVPRRLTYHPGADTVAGWTPDGKNTVFRSNRSAYSRFARLFTVPATGGFPAEVPLHSAYEASYSPDGAQVAYVPVPRAFTAWKRYRGGRATPVWIARLSDSQIQKVPRDNSNDFNPMWAGDKVYFLSDREGPVWLYAYTPATKQVAAVVRSERGIRSASAGPGAIVYEELGALYLLDLKSNKPRKLEIRITADLPSVRPRFEKVGTRIRSAGISPTGARAVFEARGEILTVPAEKGSVRNLTNTPGVAERYPAWSPEGKRIAYFSDEAGEYALHIREQSGMGEVKKIALGDPPSFFYNPIWSPDSKKIAYTDKRLNVWYVDLEKGIPKKVDTDTYETPVRRLDPTWSPDSKWIAYTKQLKNHLRAVFAYSIERAEADRITDGMSDARYAQFDRSGKYLFFTASTNAGPTTGWLDMSAFPFRVTSSVYVAVLRKDLPSPLAPESDDEKPADAAKPGDAAKDKEAAKEKEAGKDKGAAKDKEADKATTPDVKIDMENISQRILALPIPAREYVGLEAGKEGLLFLAELSRDTPAGPPQQGPQLIIHKFDLKTRKADKFIEGVNSFDVSFNGEKALYRHGERWTISPTAQTPKPNEGTIKTADMEIRVDPPAEWRQMYREAWRIERDFFYDPNLHGLDREMAEKKYAVYLDGLGSRAELNDVFNEAFGDLTVGHLYVGGGDTPTIKRVPGGLLGADYTIENRRYRFARVYNGENWNPQLRAPLTEPGVNVEPGDYLLAVNGRDLTAADNVYGFFEATAGKQVVLKVGKDPSGANAREVTVVPIENETGLRNLAWIEQNRRKVDELSGGRLAYVYLPDTSVGGYTNFNRYYFAQLGKDGAVIDERYNGGGTAADYIIDYMRRPLWNYWATREGEDFTTPFGSIYGPKAMIINESAGSGGDAMPWYFRKAGIGKLVGTRTWGGLVGIYDYPQLMDGGSVTAPRVAFWNPDGTWDVENHGVAPDVPADMDPASVRKGRDPQLEKAVEVVLQELKNNPPPKHRKPAFPNYYKAPARPARAATGN